MPSETEGMDLVEIGFYYGYPPCCIAAFMTRWHAITTGQMPMSQIKAQRKAWKNKPWMSTGFLPCPVCMAAIGSSEALFEEFVERKITPSRKCPTPFPEDGLGDPNE